MVFFSAGMLILFSAKSEIPILGRRIGITGPLQTPLPSRRFPLKVERGGGRTRADIRRALH